MRVGVHRTPPLPRPPPVVLWWDFLKHCFLKNSLKRLLRHFYICLCLRIHRHPLGNLALHFLGENLNKFDNLYTFPYIYFMLKDHRKPHFGTRYKEI